MKQAKQANNASKTATAQAAEQVINGHDHATEQDTQAQSQEQRRENAFERYMAAQEEMLKEWGVPSGKRALAAITTSLIASFGVGYVGAVLTEMATMAVITLTGITALGIAVWCVGLVITLAVSLYAGPKVYAYIASKKLDAHVDAVKNKFTRWFGSADTNELPIPAAAAMQ